MSLNLKHSGGGGYGGQQFPLIPVEGFSGNGMATVSPDHVFSVIAHLPPLQTLSPGYPAVYAVYLTDQRAQSGFCAGSLRPAGNGVFQLIFRSQVPLVHYNKILISLEDPRLLNQWPQGPVVMRTKEGLMSTLAPVKKAGGDIWGRVNGIFGRSKKKDTVAEIGDQGTEINPES